MTKEKEFKQMNELLEKLQQQLLSKEEHEKQLKKYIDQIIAVDYDNVESIIANTFLFGKLRQITDYLKMKYPVETHFIGIPNLNIAENNDHYCISVTGIKGHHDEFKVILKRIQSLSNAVKLAKSSYEKQLNSKLTSIRYIMIKRIQSTQDWKYYCKYYLDLVKDKIDDFVKLYDEYIIQNSKKMVDFCITDGNFNAQNQIKRITENYMKKKQFLPELELIKSEALEEYIKQHILSERSKFEKKPSKKSIETMHEFIDKVKKELKTNSIYHGCDVDQFKHIPRLLQRLMLYYRSFLLQLPLYDLSKTLFEKIQNNTVITIATSTGSGKLS